MKLSDYVISFLYEQGVRHVFGLTGGAVVHLFDSAEKHPGVNNVFCHHEQAASLAAAAYSRINCATGAAIVTTGPGGTNALTGVAGAWQDSIPCFFISGQSAFQFTSHGTAARQIGVQELDITTIVRSITKYAELVSSPEDIRYHLEKAAFLSQHGRPGPVWVDIPVNFQWADIVPENLRAFIPENEGFGTEKLSAEGKAYQEVVRLLRTAKRPVFLAGYGVRLAHAEEEFVNLVTSLEIPFVTTWTSSDICPFDCRINLGRIGFFGQRGANLAIQNSDLVVAVGSHLSVALTGSVFEGFAREAKIVVVNIDSQVFKHNTVRVDVPLACDAGVFLKKMLEALPSSESLQDLSPWRNQCFKYREHNLIPENLRRGGNYVNSYVFVDALSDRLVEGDTIVVDGGGTNMFVSFQAFKTKKNQRLTLSSSLGAMGTGLPESIGACFANGRRQTICLIGDGSFQLNIQELQTIWHHSLPIKIFIINNRGYLAIRHTQKAFLDSNFVGTSPETGISMPDYQKIGTAYGIETLKIEQISELDSKLDYVLAASGPCICEIMVSPNQEMNPRQGFRRNEDGSFSALPLDQMEPPLPEEELLRCMIVKPYVRKE